MLAVLAWWQQGAGEAQSESRSSEGEEPQSKRVAAAAPEFGSNHDSEEEEERLGRLDLRNLRTGLESRRESCSGTDS